MRGRAAVLAAAGIVAAAVAWHFWRRLPPEQPRGPFHAALLPRHDSASKAALEEVAALARVRALRRVPMGGAGDPDYQAGLERLRAAPAGALFLLEEAALDRGCDPSLRVDLLNLVAVHRGEETRRFLSALAGDPSEDPAVRIAALEPLMAYRDPETFEVLRRAWLDPAPFDGRYHVVRALGESGRPEALPLLRDALAPGRTASERSAAATALGGFVAQADVRAELARLALGDPISPVRQNALLALARSDAPEAEETLRRAAEGGDPEARRVAERILKGRKP